MIMMYNYHISDYWQTILKGIIEEKNVGYTDACHNLFDMIKKTEADEILKDYMVAVVMESLITCNYSEDPTGGYASIVGDGSVFFDPVFAERLERLLPLDAP